MSAFVIFGVLAALLLMEYLSVGARAEKLLFHCSADRELTEPGGVVTVNLNMRAGGAGNINERLIDTISAVFPAIRTVAVENGTNLALFAARDEATLSRLPQRAEKLQDRELAALMRHVAANWQSPPRRGEPLTDDKAPVELLGMRAIDAIIQEELHYYKGIYRQEGFEGLRKAL